MLLRQQGDSTRLITLSGAARLTPANGVQQIIEPRRSVLFDQTSILQQAPASRRRYGLARRLDRGTQLFRRRLTERRLPARHCARKTPAWRTWQW